MKYFIRVIIVLLIASGIIFAYSYHYRQEKIADSIELTTADISPKQSTTKAQRQLITESKEGNYQLYLDGDNVILSHDGIEKSFSNWASEVKQETPQLFYKDYDDDGDSELLIKLVSGVTNDNGTDKYVYNLYLAEPVEKNGKSDFNIISATADTWKVPFEEAIKAEMSQLKSCDKIIQFVMDNADVSLTYDSKTGLANNKYSGFAAALKNNNGSYEKLVRWNKGGGFYNVDDKGNITLDIRILAYYDGVKNPQYIGNIHTQIGVVNGKFDIIPSTISFVANDEYKVASPLNASSEKWTSTINNSFTPTVREGDDMVIDWIEASFDLSQSFDEKTLSFSGMSSQIKCVDKVVITPSKITMTAKEGYTFSSSVIRNFGFFVKISPNTNFEYNIEYNGEIKNVDGRSVLVIHFDRAYDREVLNGMLINFGV